MTEFKKQLLKLMQEHNISIGRDHTCTEPFFNVSGDDNNRFYITNLMIHDHHLKIKKLSSSEGK